MDAVDSTSTTTANFHWLMNLQEKGISDPCYPEGYPYTLEGQIDSQGYLLAVFYTSAQPSGADTPNFSVRCVLIRSTDTVFDTTLTRDQCKFKDQISDIEKTDFEYTNVNKKTFYIKIKKPVFILKRSNYFII